MEIGQARGLAADLQFDKRIADLRYNKEADLRAEKMAEARAKMFVDDMEFQNAINAHDAPIVKQWAKEHTRKIGEFYRNNPDVLYNPDKLAQLNLMKRELKDNPDLHRGIASDMSYKQFQQDRLEAEKHPTNFDADAYASYDNQWKNYLQYGNQNGPEAAQKEGRQPFVYSRPKDLEPLETALPGLGNKIKDYDVVQTENGGWYTQPKSGQLEQLKRLAYSQYDREIELAAKKLGLDTQEKVDQWVSENISAGFDKSHSLGDPLAIRRLQLQEAAFGLDLAKAQREGSQTGGGIMPWEDVMNPNKPSVAIPKEVFKQVWPTQTKLVFTGTGGQKADLTGYDFEFDGSIHKPQKGPYKGLPFAVGHVDIPIEEAKELRIVKGKNWFGEDDVDEYDVENGYDPKRVQIRKIFSKDGTKSRVIARLLTEIPLDPTNTTAHSLYQTATAPAKQYEPEQRRSAYPAGAMVDEAGNVFDAQGNYLGPQSNF